MAGQLVLCYHAASATWEDQLSISPEVILRTVERLRGRAAHVTFDDAYRSVAGVAVELVRRGTDVTVFACSGYADTGAPLAVPELRAEAQRVPDELATMTWAELDEIARAGVRIGSHTVDHPHLTEVGDAELEYQVAASRAAIEDRLGRACRTLAYPYGQHDARVRRAAAAAGYELAFGLAPVPGAGCFGVPRIDLYRRDGPLVTRLKTGPARRPLVAVLDATGVRRGRRHRG